MYKKSVIFIGLCALVCFGVAWSGALNTMGTQIATGLGVLDSLLFCIGMAVRKKP